MTTLLIENSRVLDVHSLTLRTGLSVLVQDGRIAAVGADLIAPEGATVLDARGMTLMPGLIDCHVHVVASSFNPCRGQDAQCVHHDAFAAHHEGHAGAGFTTVRDAGGADWSLAEAVRTGLVWAAHASSLRARRCRKPAGMQTSASATTTWMCARAPTSWATLAAWWMGWTPAASAVREEILKGATQIKVMASGGVASPNDPIGNLGYSEAELRAIAEEASNANTYVMAHAYTPRAIARAVRCGA